MQCEKQGENIDRYEQIFLLSIASIGTLVFQFRRSFPYRAIAITQPWRTCPNLLA